MFVIFATKPLDDNTKGFRYNFLGKKGLYRKRKTKTRYGIDQGDCMIGYHFGKRSLYVVQASTKRKLYHYAGQETADMSKFEKALREKLEKELGKNSKPWLDDHLIIISASDDDDGNT